MTWDEVYELMRDKINAVIVDGETPGSSLSVLIEVTLLDILEKRHLFENPLDEPVFYRRKFKEWVKDAVQTKEKEQKVFGNLLKKTQDAIFGTRDREQ